MSRLKDIEDKIKETKDILDEDGLYWYDIGPGGDLDWLVARVKYLEERYTINCNCRKNSECHICSFMEKE